jgi:lipoate-protein ligase A
MLLWYELQTHQYDSSIAVRKSKISGVGIRRVCEVTCQHLYCKVDTKVNKMLRTVLIADINIQKRKRT